MNSDDRGIILVAPHHFPDLDREEKLAAETGFLLVVASDVAEFRAALPTADVVMITPYAKLTADDFPTMARCRAVIRYGIGYDNIDVAAATLAGIPVSIVPGTASEEVASHAFAMGLALARRLTVGDAAIREGGWAATIGFDTPVLSQLQVGVVGLGRIGAQVAAMWSSVGAKVHGYDPYVTASPVTLTDLPTVFEQSDVISLHLPLAENTRHLMGRDELARVRRGAIVINVSRGGLIDEDALAEALTSGQVGGAGIDTFSEEPLPATSALRAAPRTILTPHIAWRSDRSTGALQEGAVHRVRLALTGQPLIDLVN